MSAALLTLTGTSIVLLMASLLLAFVAETSMEIARHVLLGIFGTLLNLLAHSLMIFYLIGKGKAVKEAVTEHGLGGDYVARVSQVRAPVFARATIAMTITMVAAIIGASVDVQVLPPWPHATIALVSVAVNFHALLSEISALRGTSLIVDEVNKCLEDSPPA
jgi:hypothetical protein